MSCCYLMCGQNLVKCEVEAKKGYITVLIASVLC